ncbi:MAG: primosomal protein N' [Gammaproteobacteria bacterium]|nr:primosomal protein N' [Gammaproteobacteria bacterium]
MSCGKLFSTSILRIALDVPTREVFDYLPGAETDITTLQPGMRLLVPFGKRRLVGVLVDIADKSHLPAGKLKKVFECLDSTPAVSPDTLKLLQWAGEYYHHPLGEVVVNALPTLLRAQNTISPAQETVWCLTDKGRSVDVATLTRAPAQVELLEHMIKSPEGLRETVLDQSIGNWRATMKRLLAKEWVGCKTIKVPRLLNTKPEGNNGIDVSIALNEDQWSAMQTVCNSFDSFKPFLLEGVTGSGKTEVYLEIIAALIQSNQQALVLVPEINLTPQLTRRFQARFSQSIAVLHSQLTDKQRLDAWLAAMEGEVDIVIGTRSAVTVQLPRLGLIVVDEEHDTSFKQQEGFRYSARDMAVMRAQLLKIPVVLGSATPSFESLHNVNQGRYQDLKLTQRFGAAKPPRMQLIDLRKQPLFDGLSRQLLDAMKQHLGREHQVLLFINRRGFAPTLLCHDCGWIARCLRCEAHMTYHRAKNQLRCHHCGAERRAEQSCPDCRSTALIPVGEGTERIEQALLKHFPGTTVVRIDRDTTRRKGSLESLLQEVHEGGAKILLGTQMLAKGHHFPDVTLAGILNVDQGLFSVDFRALEKTAQLIVQVAGRAGRAEKPGEVMLQTHYPDHPLLQTLLNSGYAQFAQQALQEREQAGLPPFSYMALLRAEAVNAAQPLEFLREAKALAQELAAPGIALLGPLPSPMEKRAGRYRAQLFIQSGNRAALHKLLHPWVLALEHSKLGRKVRWSIDVDPVDVY